MSTVTVTLTLNTDTYELDIQGDAIPLDFALSIIKRACRRLEQQEKIIIVQQMGQAQAQAVSDHHRTEGVMRKIKLQ